uniref:Putative secreted protein n=1 Tax=Ixodes ricinus TaxID=34613 RepID=A0A6B0UD50_IXORI
MASRRPLYWFTLPLICSMDCTCSISSSNRWKYSSMRLSNSDGESLSLVFSMSCSWNQASFSIFVFNFRDSSVLRLWILFLWISFRASCCAFLLFG